MCIPAKKWFITSNHKSNQLIPAPIDEKNIVSDWIDGELLTNCTQNNNEYLGWLDDDFPVYGKIHKNGQLELRSFYSWSMPQLIYKLTQIFNGNMDNDIALQIKEEQESLWLSFYFIIDD